MTDVMQAIEDSGQTIPEIMGEMMERGYVVTGQQGSVSLMKIATDSDPKVTINPGVENPSVLTGFETKMHAIVRYLEIRTLKEPVVPKLIAWTGLVRYEVGRNIKFHELEPIQAATYEEAMDQAKDLADSFIESHPDLKAFGYKEVKVRPSH